MYVVEPYKRQLAVDPDWETIKRTIEINTYFLFRRRPRRRLWAAFDWMAW